MTRHRSIPINKPSFKDSADLPCPIVDWAGIELAAPHSRPREMLGGARALFLLRKSLREERDGYRVSCPLVTIERLNPLNGGARRTARRLLLSSTAKEARAIVRLAATVSLVRQGLLPKPEAEMRSLLEEAGHVSLEEIWQNRATRLLPSSPKDHDTQDVDAWLSWIAGNLVVARVVPRATGPMQSGAIKAHAFLSVFPEMADAPAKAPGTDAWRALTAEELGRLVWEDSLSGLAARFGVTRTSVARACRRLNVEMPPADYWQSRAATERWRKSSD